MKRETISLALGNIPSRYITEAEQYTANKTRTATVRTVLFKTPLAACLVILLLTGAMAFAAYEVHEWSTAVVFEDGTKVNMVEKAAFKSLPSTAPKHPQPVSMTHADVEELLGFDILYYDNATSDTLSYMTHENEDGSIGRVDLWWADFLHESDDKMMTLHISMLNEGADLGYILAFEEGTDAAGGKELQSIVEDERLGTRMIVYSSGAHRNVLTVAFVYEDILYQFDGYDMTQAEMLAVIEQMA